MFTGIIEEIGTVRGVTAGGRAGEITIGASLVLEGTKTGDSIAVNGVCLTVTRLTASGFTADVMPETLRRSNLGVLTTGDRVDLERALPADGRFGGHIVSGHIDDTGRIASLSREQNAVWLTIEADPALLRLIAEKGSVAIDGVSLTVAEAGDRSFRVSIIPHTGSRTILLDKRPGDKVNLETDILAKYVQKLLTGGAADAGRTGASGLTGSSGRDDIPGRTESDSPGRSAITMSLLAENGFLE